MSNQSRGEIPSNEEIVDELTKDLQQTLRTDENAHIPDENSSNESSDCENNQNSAPSIEPEISDDEELKKQELNLSDEEKESRRNEAINLKNQGNEHFKANECLESINTYTQALRLCPLKFSSDRAILYANRAASKIKIDRKASAIDDCTKAVQLNDKYVRAYLRRAKLYEDTDKLDESLEDYKKILELDPGNKDALSASCRLPPLINERNEKMKEEMLGKLKDLGNMFLRPFGLSTNNFNLQQDPSTGSYSVNFQQNPSC